MESVQASRRGIKRQRVLVVFTSDKVEESCLDAGLFDLIMTPSLGTVRVTDSKGFSLNCPISVVDASNDHRFIAPPVSGLVDEHQHLLFEIEPKQLSLSFNVHRIDQTLSLAPNGQWSKMDYHLNKDVLVNEFFNDFKGLTKTRIRNKKKYIEAFDMVLANLFLTHYESSQLLLSRQNGKHKDNNPAGIDNRTIASITDYLADRGLIDLHIGRSNKDDKNSSWCIPLQPLVAILDRHDAKLRLHQKTQLAVVRDGDKNPIPMYTNKKKRLALARYARPVAQHYQTWLSHTATLDGKYLLPWLRRLFNWNMELGGRFYGHYQQIPSADRKRILIDGERTVELDYKAVHIALLYAIESLPLDADAYIINGRKDKRDTYKAICLTLVNTEKLSSLQANVTRSANPKVKEAHRTYTAKRQHYEYRRALGLKATEPSKPKSLQGFINNIPSGSSGSELLQIIMEHHHPIAHHFGTEHIGLRLQKLDSELIANALTKLQGIPCLPVHDSIRCKVSDMQLVTNAMTDAFRELHGQNIIVEDDIPKNEK